ncbi:restriction endonuclease subunit S [Halomonas denitrificans]|uniref:restriction endonuclease subunit S n=1 Tax=Halomonas denitrificans TaxID=370769 RepID=UPI001CD81313|nr:restriction endonuclease subunit S [Halomonas denitrificans]MCA0974751.1 restriction endonuclease subunit S [Halomonas denitrificans]
MKGYAAYPSYKTTNSPWLESIPEHWEAKRVKDVATYNDESLDEKADPDIEIEYVDISSVSLTHGIEKTELLSFEKAPSRARRKVKHGDVIVSTVRTYLKAIAPVSNPPSNMVVSTGFAVIRARPNLDPRFAGYMLQSSGFVGDVVANSVGVSYPAINASDLARLPFAEPPLAEQRVISDFLDHKTAQIDALIAKKQALLDKLAEQRTALVSLAVTKGLDLSVPMKDSGVEWLGEIPAHWEMSKLRFVIDDIEQGWSPQCHNQSADEEQWGVLKVGCVNGETFNPDENKALPEDLDPRERYEIQAGDILVSRANTKELLGSAAIVTTVRRKLLLCDKLYRIKPNGKVDSNYLLRFLRSSVARYQYEKDATGTSGSMQNIGQDTMKNLLLPLPPLSEQVAIADELQQEQAKNLLIENKIESVIWRLQEYREALIANAITGKIDVRKFFSLNNANHSESVG